jgi:tRNA G10  N-methylase Trm11
LLRADAQRVALRDNSATAVVTNLPFGRQHVVQGSPVAWYRRVLTESLRIAPQAVVLAAATTPFRQALGRLDADLAGRYEINLLGNRTVIWDVRRRADPTTADPSRRVPT